MRERFLTSLNLKEKEVKRMRNGKWFIVLTMVFAFCLVTASAYALPTLLTTEPTKMKFTNFENWIDNGDGLFNAGDAFEGIFTVTSIGNYTDDPFKFTWFPVVTDGAELTGVFRLSVVGSVPAGGGAPGGAFHLDFAMQSGDYFTMYYDTTPNWNALAADAVARASDGVKYMEVLPAVGPLPNGTNYEGYNETTFTASVNRNWAYLTTNNTGYPITPLQWPETIGQIDPHWYLGAFHPAGHVSDLFWETHLQTLVGNPMWGYKSEDPVLLQPVPEPATMLLFGSGLIGLAGFARRRISRNKK